ncbi:MAG TPA: hypothetical protein DCZ94_17225 [Lentisphaeria bacterium]|nr:MAG: hypothetical protein A2X48_20955 [Lentisphaerae bacterium GWF2_49_21]HBC88687.1 hypothetical protein [Lentisphaeria bacterium]
MEIRVTRVRKIYSDGRHNAFTGITSFNKRTYIAFRSGKTHVSMDGVITVIASDDMESWKEAAEITDPSMDLRDAKVVGFNDQLMVFYAGRNDDKHSSISFRTSKVSMFDRKCRLQSTHDLKGVPEGYWMWCVKPYRSELYGTAYRRIDGVYHVKLFRSADGIEWRETADFPVPGGEVHIDFDQDGTLWALVRDDCNNSIPTLCRIEPPYDKFSLSRALPLRMQGPMIKRLNGGCVIIGRCWDGAGRRNTRTDMYWIEDDQEPCFIRTLPSGGDTSYADWLDTAPGRAVVSYYSAHEYKMDEPHENEKALAKDPGHFEHTTGADIYLADISYK